MSGSGDGQKNNLDRYIGHQVKWCRRDKRILAEVMALKMGMELEHYRDCEEGRVRFTSEEIYRLTEILEVDIDDFYPQTKPPERDDLDPRSIYPSDLELHQMLHFFSGVTDPAVRSVLLQSVRLASSFDE